MPRTPYNSAPKLKLPPSCRELNPYQINKHTQSTTYAQQVPHSQYKIPSTPLNIF